MSSNEIEFVKGVNKLHAFYTEHVRMLAHAYDLTDRQAATLLDDTGTATWHGPSSTHRGCARPGTRASAARTCAVTAGRTIRLARRPDPPPG
ncbi:hypothetical protein SDC9_186655 [bioreactor metagenome]|uniref:Uncharacterized protein n=1 Tax=bioreactor metagenome TaxID=1076179 RepID=A0A645HJD9_9ZZZZ